MKTRIVAALAALALVSSAPAFAAKTTPGEAVDDSTVTATIKAALFDNKNTHSAAIHVETYKGIVLLSGFVKTQAEKDAAGAIAKDTSGVKEVRNSIALHDGTSSGTKLDDTVVTSRVKAALIDAADVKSGQVNVETEGGIVQLAGFVKSQKMKDRAAEIAAAIDGVKRVDNVLVVKPD
jgi:hyperosmotically inducible protein